MLALPVKKRKIDFLVDLLEFGLHDDVALALGRVPNFLQIVDSLAPFVHQQRRRLGVRWLDPWREKATLVGLVPAIE